MVQTSLTTCKPQRSKGFTLIEILVALAIVGILAAVAYPMFSQHIMKSRRAAAQSFMIEMAQKELQYLADGRTYATLAELGLATPSEVSPYYSLAIDVQAGPPPRFTITATPIGSQVTNGALTLDNAGAKTPTSVW